MKNSRYKFEKQINEMLETSHQKRGFGFEKPINLKKLNLDELMYFFRLVKRMEKLEQKTQLRFTPFIRKKIMN
jgi:hypothetical protein